MDNSGIMVPIAKKNQENLSESFLYIKLGVWSHLNQGKKKPPFSLTTFQHVYLSMTSSISMNKSHWPFRHHFLCSSC